MLVTQLGDSRLGSEIMLDYSAHIERMEDCEAILEYVYVACREEGAVWFGYYFTPIFEAVNSSSTFIWARGVSTDFERRYFSEGFRDINPVPRLTMANGYILTWRKAMEAAKGDAEAERYFDFFKELGVKNWASFALFGPRNRKAFASLRFGGDPENFDEGRLTHIHSILQSAHLRICAIMDGGGSAVALSERERQVLRLMGKGKSAGAIGDILEISPETVKTYIKRIYEKLETNDRVTATVRALKMGLVEL